MKVIEIVVEAVTADDVPMLQALGVSDAQALWLVRHPARRARVNVDTATVVEVERGDEQ